MWGIANIAGSFSWRVKIKPEPSLRPERGVVGKLLHYDTINNIRVVTNEKTGKVISVF